MSTLDRTAWYEWVTTDPLDRYVITDKDLRYLRHFWEEYRDLSRYMEFSRMGKELCRYRPDIVEAWELWLPAQAAFNTWLRGLGYDTWENESFEEYRVRAITRFLMSSEHKADYIRLGQAYQTAARRLTRVLETCKYKNEK